jgi:PLP dependent protein
MPAFRDPLEPLPEALQAAIAAQIQLVRAHLPPQVRLIAVSKQMPAAYLRAAYAAGIRDFGENQVQEAEAKGQQLSDLPDLVWHLIGHLQSNKTRRALDLFDWIHSVDSLELAQRLARQIGQRPSSSLPPQLCLQVKLRPDPTKYGWQQDALMAVLPELAQLPITFAGLMTIAPFDLPDAELETLFSETVALQRQIQAMGYPNLQLTECSMGMSDDYALAARCGSTMVRVGRLIFGDRP